VSRPPVNRHLPTPPIPEGHTTESWLQAIAVRGASRRYGSGLTAEIRTRIEEEQAAITACRAARDLLIVAEYVNWASKNASGSVPARE